MRNRTKSFAVFALVVLFLIGVLEVAGRILPIQMGFGQSITYLRFHPVLGSEVDPNLATLSHSNACFNIKAIAINQAGMRSSREYPLVPIKEGPRIALLGDSFIMGREVSDGEEAAAAISRQLLEGDALNFGVPGYGSIQQLYTYELKARNYSPDIVVLAFLEVNDVEDNSDLITAAAGWGSLRPMFDNEGELVAPDPNAWSLIMNRSSGGDLHYSLRRYSYIYFILDKLIMRVRRVANRTWGVGAPSQEAGIDEDYWWAKDNVLMHAGVYQSPPDPVWQQAWNDTELAIERLNQMVTKDGSKFVVMLLPSTGSSYSASLPERYADVIGEEMPSDIDLMYPRNRLRQFTAAQGIEFLDLNDNFDRYQEINQPLLPGFYYMCDGHFSPLGHYVTAHSLLDRLLEKGWVSEDDMANPEQYKSDDYLQVSPEELLGPEAMDTIYNWARVYEGGSRASER